MATLRKIVNEKVEWRGQIASLGVFDLNKRARGAVLGWVWFFVKPAVYIGVFWLALAVGLRAGGSGGASGNAPYILWLMSGLIAWFYMQDMLNIGSDVFHRYSYLVNKIKFPISGIPTIFNISTMIIQLGLVVVMLAVYFICGQPVDLYLVQLPIAILLMVLFFDMFSLLASCLSALSKDFKNLVQTLSTPLFWLSGIIFDVFGLGIDWLTNLLMVNPVTFFATMYRGAIYDKVWIWERPEACIGMLVVFVVTFVATILVYHRTHEEVSDVL